MVQLQAGGTAVGGVDKTDAEHLHHTSTQQMTQLISQYKLVQLVVVQVPSNFGYTYPKLARQQHKHNIHY